MHPKRPIAKIVAAAALLLLVTFGTGCETDDPIGGLRPSCMSFNPEKDPVDGEVVSASADDSTCDTTVIEMLLTDVEDVWSVQFEILYPDAISQFFFIDASQSFLVRDGAELIIEFEEDPPGRIEIGVTRVDTGVNQGITPTADDNQLLRLAFVRFLSSGQGDVTFEDASIWVRTAPGAEPVPADPAVPFSGGELVIQ